MLLFIVAANERREEEGEEEEEEEKGWVGFTPAILLVFIGIVAFSLIWINTYVCVYVQYINVYAWRGRYFVVLQR